MASGAFPSRQKLKFLNWVVVILVAVSLFGFLTPAQASFVTGLSEYQSAEVAAPKIHSVLRNAPVAVLNDEKLSDPVSFNFEIVRSDDISAVYVIRAQLPPDLMSTCPSISASLDADGVKYEGQVDESGMIEFDSIGPLSSTTNFRLSFENESLVPLLSADVQLVGPIHVEASVIQVA